MVSFERRQELQVPILPHDCHCHSFAVFLAEHATMLHTSLVVELLRSRPRLMFRLAVLSQAVLWFLVPSLFYASPPGNLPLVLAVGHEFQFGSAFGPPLAFWLAEIAYRIGGAPGVYLLSQACVAAAFFGVYALARAIVGLHHAVLAVLLMAGILAFAAPTPDFGPAILAVPLTVFSLLFLWLALSRRRWAWFALALSLGLLLMTTWMGLVLVAAIAAFLGLTGRGRRTLRWPEPWIASVIVAAVIFPHLIWFDLQGPPLSDLLPDLDLNAMLGHAAAYLELLVVSHAGLMLLVVLAARWRRSADADKFAVFSRRRTSPFAARFVYFFAVVPALIAVAAAGLFTLPAAPGAVAPFVALSGLAVVVFAGRAIVWPRPVTLATAWGLLLLGPPLAVAASIVGLPWLGVPGAAVDRPAAAIGGYFADSFTRRTGSPLAIVAGDPATAALVALGAPGRPSLLFDANPKRTPWITPDDLRRKGAVVVWPATDTRAEVPATLAARFQTLVADVPRSFERRFQGRLPLIRIGYGVLRPQADAAAPPASP